MPSAHHCIAAQTPPPHRPASVTASPAPFDPSSQQIREAKNGEACSVQVVRWLPCMSPADWTLVPGWGDGCCLGGKAGRSRWSRVGRGLEVPKGPQGTVREAACCTAGTAVAGTHAPRCFWWQVTTGRTACEGREGRQCLGWRRVSGVFLPQPFSPGCFTARSAAL